MKLRSKLVYSKLGCKANSDLTEEQRENSASYKNTM